MRMSLEEWKQFFKTFAGQTPTQQAALVRVSIGTIYKWRKRCGIPSRPIPPQFLLKIDKLRITSWDPVPEDWNNREWLAETYKKYGMNAIAKMVGKKPKWICDRLRQLGIKTDPDRTTNGTLNKDPEWVYYHYATRSEYLDWCMNNDITPDDLGGQFLSAEKCAALAGVTYQTFINGLLQIGVRIRKRGEKNQTSMDVRQINAADRRLWRSIYFEKYRQGILPLTVGRHIFKHGKLVGIKTDLDYRTVENPSNNP